MQEDTKRAVVGIGRSVELLAGAVEQRRDGIRVPRFSDMARCLAARTPQAETRLYQQDRWRQHEEQVVNMAPTYRHSALGKPVGRRPATTVHLPPALPRHQYIACHAILKRLSGESDDQDGVRSMTETIRRWRWRMARHGAVSAKSYGRCEKQSIVVITGYATKAAILFGMNG